MQPGFDFFLAWIVIATVMAMVLLAKTPEHAIREANVEMTAD